LELVLVLVLVWGALICADDLCVKRWGRLQTTQALKKSVWEYKPLQDACWTAGNPTPYVHLAECFAILVRKPGNPLWVGDQSSTPIN